MKSKLGITLRKVRKGKQISICSVADEHLSKSQISRFERGESEMPMRLSTLNIRMRTILSNSWPDAEWLSS